MATLYKSLAIRIHHTLTSDGQMKNYLKPYAYLKVHAHKLDIGYRLCIEAATYVPTSAEKQEEWSHKHKVAMYKAAEEPVRVPKTKAELKAARKAAMMSARENPGSVLPEQYDGTLAFTPELLKSRLFGHRSGKREIFGGFTTVPAYGKTKIEFQGEELRQDDLRVLLALIRIRAGGGCETAIEFNPRKFCVKTLGWGDSGGSVEKLNEAILRLHDAKCRLYYAHEEIGKEVFQGISFITEFAILKGAWSVQLSPSLVTLLTGWYRSYMKVSERMSMKDGLGSWLYGVIKADSCELGFDLEQLRAVSGSPMILKEFNRAVKKSMAEFEKMGVVAGFTLKNGHLSLRKTASAGEG